MESLRNFTVSVFAVLTVLALTFSSVVSAEALATYNEENIDTAESKTSLESSLLFDENLIEATLKIITPDDEDTHTLRTPDATLEEHLLSIGYHADVLRTEQGEKIPTDLIVEDGDNITLRAEQTSGKTETVTIPKLTEVIESSEIYKGEKIVQQAGRNGKALQTTITYTKTTEDGSIVSSTEQNFIILQSPQKRITLVGTKECESAYLCEFLKNFDHTITGEKYVHPLGEPRNWTTYSGSISHDGGAIDFPATTGTPIYAVADGVVTSSGWENTGGNVAHISHADGNTTVYAHMVEEPVVAEGERVRAGQIIGFVGSTGFSTGPHLHFDVRIDGIFGNFYPSHLYLTVNGVDVGNCISGSCHLATGEFAPTEIPQPNDNED